MKPVGNHILPVRLSVVVAETDPSGGILLQWRRREKSSLAVLVMSGTGVGSRELERDNPVVRRILDSGDVVFCERSSRLDYVKKSFVDMASAELEREGKRVVGVYVAGDPDSFDYDEAVDSVRIKRLAFNALKSDPGLCSFLAARTFRKLLLPVLVFWLLVLLANWFAFSSLNDSLAKLRLNGRAVEAVAREETAKNTVRNRLAAGLDISRGMAASFWSDEVAAAVPEGMRLTEIRINDPKARKKNAVPSGTHFISVKGEVLGADALSSFTDRLRGSFRRVEVTELRKVRNGTHSEFEIHILL